MPRGCGAARIRADDQDRRSCRRARQMGALRRAPDGTPADIVEMSTDITDVRRTEDALGRIQYQYQNLFQASVASFWELEFGAVGGMVRELAKTGVSDLRDYFRKHPEFVRSMIQATRIVDFNEQRASRCSAVATGKS